MTAPRTDQELVVHAFAPLRGKHAERGRTRLLGVWRRSEELLGTTSPVAGIELPTSPPDVVVPGGPEGLCAAQNAAVDIQLIMRRVHDVLVLSVFFAAPDAPGLASGVPPGWIEFDRWWEEIAGSGTDGLLGVALIHQATRSIARDSLPKGLRGSVDWSREHRQGDFVLWEPPRDTTPVRRLVVSAPAHQDAELSAWTWSRGDAAMPPLGRYLLQAAKLRHHVRVWRDDENWLTQLRNQVDEHVGELLSGRPRTGVVGELHSDEAGLVVAADRVERMRASVEISRSNMAALQTEPLPADVGLADWFLAQLSQEGTQLDRSRALARDVRQLARPVQVAAPVRPEHNAIRLGFMLDVVRYSARSTPEMARLQQRVADLVDAVLGALDLTLADCDHQGTGDGLMVFLPAHVDIQRAVPVLLRETTARLGLDNDTYRDRLRVRMALDVGPMGLAALGFSGKIASVMGRLLDSAPLRRAVVDHPAADLVAMVSDRLHGYVVGEGVPDVAAEEFDRVDIAVKTFHAEAWLWTSAHRGKSGNR
ncbi:CATRA conflict system CASPASE/TPR repeat-associated protein [Saccharothrix longispora]|uniref:CATRA conflict system CASPASE/TPR repeat-associated protein n=1 Tax=Saccharothrix longispora TaxID=33920 RepID=UPI0028FD9AC6|nr:CATRA conflict system CASPASE/TPR repeat-associated protein [Saccharothrix longispora]MDU0291476.1 CATRA conflict system CASPASE/TPR repeat-associated protein [Saccharothrix longispora]